MKLTPDHTYKLTFISTFATLDGIYTIQSIQSYNEVVANGIDLFVELYEVVGATDVVFRSDLDDLRKADIIKCVNVVTEKIHYISDHLLALAPDIYVGRYVDFGLAVNLGYCNDPDTLTTLKSEIDALITATLGVPANAVVYEKTITWMTEADYNAIQAQYDANITNTSNVYTDRVTLSSTVDAQRVKLDYYENLLIAHQP